MFREKKLNPEHVPQLTHEILELTEETLIHDALEQVDDVLKSLVVYDDKGGVGGLSLPGREPLAQAFKTHVLREVLKRKA